MVELFHKVDHGNPTWSGAAGRRVCRFAGMAAIVSPWNPWQPLKRLVGELPDFYTRCSKWDFLQKESAGLEFETSQYDEVMKDFCVA